MDRTIVYPAALPQDTDILNLNRNVEAGIGWLAQLICGTGGAVTGLAATAGGGMYVNIGPGTLLQLSTVDGLAYGSLPPSSTPLVKQGITTVGAAVLLAAPGTAGQSTNYLIAGQVQDVAANSILLPFFNSSNPLVPYSGPGNSGAALATALNCNAGIEAVAGTPATTGTQTIPMPPAGWMPLYVVTVPYGATAVTSGMIATHPLAPFVQYPLQQLRPGFPNGIAFNAAGAWSWTVPNGVYQIEAEIWGGGGAGNSSTSYNYPGGGGAGAGRTKQVFAVTPGQVISGTNGAGTNTAGATGGTTTLTIGGITIQATGGGGGFAGTNSAAGAGGAPGVGSGGFDNEQGAGGSYGVYGTTVAFGGFSGAAPKGGSMTLATGSATASFSGAAGNFPGGGSTGCNLGGNIAASASGKTLIRY